MRKESLYKSNQNIKMIQKIKLSDLIKINKIVYEL